MKKRYFWAMEIKDGKTFIHRFDYQINLFSWLKGSNWRKNGERFMLPASRPEIRRIHRRIASGEQIMFPVEIN